LSLSTKCTKFDFRWDSAPDPAGGAYSAPPGLLAVFKGPTSKGRAGEEGGKGKGRKGGKWEEGNGEKGRGQTPKYFGLEPPLDAQCDKLASQSRRWNVRRGVSTVTSLLQ